MENRASTQDRDDPLRGERLRSALTRIHLIGPARLTDRTVRRLTSGGLYLLGESTRIPLVGTRLVPLLARLDHRDRFNFEFAELVRVCDALRSEGLSFWITGGWGIDALVGSQTRRHGDLDIALDSFQENLSKATAVLARLGYGRKTPLGGMLWYPDAHVYEDDRGHRIELVSINWDVLMMARVLFDSTGEPAPTTNDALGRAMPGLVEKCTTTTPIDGVLVPTLTVTAQQLFHLGYPFRSEDWHADDVLSLFEIGGEMKSFDHVSRRRTPETRVPSTLLSVPVFTLPPELLKLCRLYHSDLDVVPPHVTLALPFLPLDSVTEDVLGRLSTLFHETQSFDFELDELRFSASDALYLEASKSESFGSLIETLREMFPSIHSGDDADDLVAPRVRLSDRGTRADRRALARRARTFLPLPSRVTHVWMMCNDRGPDEWSIIRIFNLGSSLVGADASPRSVVG
ncbi:MAG: 2'-5' RNA ligase family protein [Acidimicrobiales bacterium]